MKLKPEEQAELIKFLNLEEAENIEAAKEKFQADFLPAKTLNEKVGKITGTINSLAPKLFTDFGVSLTDEDFKGKKTEEVLQLAASKASENYKAKITELEARAEGKAGEEVLKQWEQKYTKLEKQLNEEKTLKANVATEFEQFKLGIESKEKNHKVQSALENGLKEIKLDPTVSQLTVEGFKGLIKSKYTIEIEDDAPVIKDAKTGEKITSKAKAGTFMTISDVLLKEATEQNIILKSPHAGNLSVKKPNQQQQQAAEKTNKVNPRFLGA